MKLSAIERAFLENLKKRRSLPASTSPESTARQRMKRMGYVRYVKGQWKLSASGAALLDLSPITSSDVSWRDLTASAQTQALQSFIANWCEEHKLNYDELCVAPRSKHRQELSIDIKRKYPDIGASIVAIYLGGLDHTTVAYAWVKAGVHQTKPQRGKSDKWKTEKHRENCRQDREFARQRRIAIRIEAQRRLDNTTRRVVMQMPTSERR